ncbi:MAG: hypothetical protein ACFE9T_03315 [Promethearchaeota archaeon]
MGIFTRKQEIRNEFRNLIKKIEKWKNLSLEDIKDSDDIFKIRLREKKPYAKRKYPRLILLSGSHKKKNYAITSFEIHNSKNNQEKFSQIYSSKVEGNHDLKKIISDLEEIIQGKDGLKIDPRYPF